MKKTITSFLFCLLVTFASSQSNTVVLQNVLDSLQKTGNYPGLSLAIIFPDNKSLALTSGYNDKEKNLPLKTTDRLMQGSVGKTYVAALTMQLLKEKKFELDDKVSRYLGRNEWYARIPNAADVTIRMLMNHTSGIMRYEFKESFSQDLAANPDKHWKPEDLVSYILDEKASFKAGEGWEYSDTNYILLGMIIEAVTGKEYVDLVQERILNPLKLSNTFFSKNRLLPGLAQGYAGENKEFGGKDKVIGVDGKFIINPQFEWTGGGVYSTTLDLARWGKYLYEGKVFDSSWLKIMLDAVPAKLGKDSKYGLGVIIRPTAYGLSWGHSGFFPGYQTELLYFPGHKICIALQANSSDFKNLKIGLFKSVLVLAKLVLVTQE